MLSTFSDGPLIAVIGIANWPYLVVTLKGVSVFLILHLGGVD